MSSHKFVFRVCTSRTELEPREGTAVSYTKHKVWSDTQLMSSKFVFRVRTSRTELEPRGHGQSDRVPLPLVI